MTAAFWPRITAGVVTPASLCLQLVDYVKNASTATIADCNSSSSANGSVLRGVGISSWGVGIGFVFKVGILVTMGPCAGLGGGIL